MFSIPAARFEIPFPSGSVSEDTLPGHFRRGGPHVLLPCSLPHMLRCLPAPKSICSVNKLASLIARKLPPGQPIPGGVAPDLSPLRLNRDTSGKTEQDARAWCRQRAAVQAGASPGSHGCWMQPQGFVAGQRLGARQKRGRSQLLSVVKWRFLARFLELASPHVHRDIDSFPCCFSHPACAMRGPGSVLPWQCLGTGRSCSFPRGTGPEWFSATRGGRGRGMEPPG